MNSGKPADSEGITGDRIAELARALWVARGSLGGRDLEHWQDAGRQLREEAEDRKRPGGKTRDLPENEKRLDGLIEEEPSPARRTPAGERL